MFLGPHMPSYLPPTPPVHSVHPLTLCFFILARAPLHPRTMADLFGPSASSATMGSRSNALASGRYAATTASAMASVAEKLSQLKFEAYDDLNSGPMSAAGAGSSYLDGNRNDVLNMNTEEAKINLDDRVYTFEFSALPSEIGKKITLQCKLGNMYSQFSSQKNDVVGATTAARPAGNHDLIQSVEFQKFQTNTKSSVLCRYPTINAFGEEHYFGGLGDAEGKKLSYLFTPADFKNGVASATVLSRPINQSMKRFLERYPNQTADTLDKLAGAMPGVKDKMMVRYSKTPGGVTSAVVLWYNSMVNGYNADGVPLKNPPLTPLNAEWVEMPTPTYNACAAKAKDELVRYISLGDVTSDEFSIELMHPSGLSLGDFAVQNPGMSENQLVADPLTGELSKAIDLHMRTPICFSGRVIIGYKKVHTGEDTF